MVKMREQVYDHKIWFPGVVLDADFKSDISFGI
jgi:hypothetical protein